MPYESKRSRSWIVSGIAFVIVFIASLLVVTTTTAHANEKPPAPEITEFHDRPGTDQDQFFVPDTDGQYSYWRSNGSVLRPGYWHSTNDRLEVSIDVSVSGGGGYYPNFQLLKFTDENPPVQAKNRFWVEVGRCLSVANDSRRVRAYIENTADSSDLSLMDVWAEPVETQRGSTTFFSYFQIGRVDDGATKSVNLNEEFSGQGLDPGNYYVNFWLGEGETYLGRSEVVTVRHCDGTPPGTAPDPAANKPRAQLRSVFGKRGSVTAIVKLDNRRVEKMNIFKIKRVFKGKVQKTKQVRVYKHKVKQVRFTQIHKGTRIKVWYKTPSGWKRILSRLVKRPGGHS